MQCLFSHFLGIEILAKFDPQISKLDEFTLEFFLIQNFLHFFVEK